MIFNFGCRVFWKFDLCWFNYNFFKEIFDLTEIEIVDSEIDRRDRYFGDVSGWISWFLENGCCCWSCIGDAGGGGGGYIANFYWFIHSTGFFRSIFMLLIFICDAKWLLYNLEVFSIL